MAISTLGEIVVDRLESFINRVVDLKGSGPGHATAAGRFADIIESGSTIEEKELMVYSYRKECTRLYRMVEAYPQIKLSREHPGTIILSSVMSIPSTTSNSAVAVIRSLYRYILGLEPKEAWYQYLILVMQDSGEYKLWTLPFVANCTVFEREVCGKVKGSYGLIGVVCNSIRRICAS